MAINKNFVIKNGIQANDNLFVADSDNNKVGINTAVPDYDFHVIGGIGATHALVTGITTTNGLLDINGGGQANTFKVEDLTDNRIVIAGTGGELEDSGNLTFDGTTLGLTGSQTISGDIDVDGHTDLDDLIVAGVSTFSANIDANGNLDVDGQTDLDVLNVAETATFTSATDNTPGDADTGAVQIDGGVGINKNVTIGGQLNVQGNSFFVGVVTFAAGTDGNIVLGDSANDNVVFNADVNSHVLPNTDDTYDLGSSSQEWRNLYLDGTANIDSLVADTADINAGTIDGATIGGATPAAGTFTNLVANGNVDLGDATSDTITATGRFDSDLVPSTDGTRDLGSSTLEWKDLYLDGTANIDSLVADTADINAGTIDGATIGANSASSGAFTTISASSNVTITGNLDVDGHTELDDLNVAGVSTFTDKIHVNSGSDANVYLLTSEDSGVRGRVYITSDGTTNQIQPALHIGVSGSSDKIQLKHNGTGVFTGNLDIGGDIDVDGRTDLDDLVVAGVSTFLDAAVFNSTGSIQIPAGTTGQRLTPALGQIRYNTQLSQFEGYGAGNAWGSLGGVKDVDGDTFIRAESAAGEDEDTLEFLTADATRVTINAAGRVGIGSTLPTTNLDVNGTGSIGGDLTVSGVSTFTGAIDANGALDVAGTVTFSTPLANSNLANSSVSYGGVSLALGATDATPAFDLSDATNYPTSSLTGTITNAQLAGSIANSKLSNSSVSFGGVSLALGAADATPAFDLSDATNYPTSSLSGTITNAQLAGSIANSKLSNSSVSFGGVSVALGAADATPAFDLSDATNYPTSSLSGTITNAQLAGSIANSKLSNSSITIGSDTIALGGSQTDINGLTSLDVDNITIDGNTVTTSSGNLTIDSAGGTTTIDDNTIISGNLTVNGTQTIVNSTTMSVDDKNLELGTGAADDAAANGGGITIVSGDGNKTFQFEATGDNLGSSENLNLASGKAYKINNTSILNATTLGSSVVNSSLTSLGTISTGVWQGTAIANAYLANSTVSFGGISLALGATDATPAFDLSDATNYPTSSLTGTITNAQLAGSIANSKLANSTVSFGGISLALGATDATPAFDLSDATNYPTSSLSGTITNAQLAGSIANSKLANSTVSFGGVSVALGAADATPAFDLQDATGYPTSSLTGTITNAQLAGSIADSKLSTISTADKVSISALNIDGANDIGAAIADADLFIVDDGAGGTNRKTAASRIKTYIADVTLTTAAQTNITSVGTLSALSVSGQVQASGGFKTNGTSFSAPIVVGQQSGTTKSTLRANGDLLLGGNIAGGSPNITLSNTGSATFAGAITIDAVTGTNNNADQAVLFQTAAGIIDGGSGLTYNPANDSLGVNGLAMTNSQIISSAGLSLKLADANHSSTTYIDISDKIEIKGNIETQKSLLQDVSTSVSSVSATSCGSFAKATYRSAYVVAQITQGSSYQVGRYLLIHDGTTVTTIEESAIATGSMLGTFEGVINGSNVEFRVTMSSASSATVITKIDSIVV